MTFRTLSIAVCFLFLQVIANCQQFNINGSTKETPAEYHVQVKQFGEFIDRFNYKTDWHGKPIEDNFRQKVSHKVYLQLLFDSEDVRFKNSSDSSYYLLQQEFISYITNRKAPLKISLYNGSVLAIAKTNILYMGKKQQATVYLVPEKSNENSLKWVINKVSASCFTSITDSLTSNFVAPNSHETNFINLKRITQVSNPIYFCNSSMTQDTTLLFLTEVAKKRLTIENIEKVSYHVSFPEWICTVEEFNREGLNSGWLISNISKKSK